MDNTKVHAYDEDGSNLSHAKLLPVKGSSGTQQISVKEKAKRLREKKVTPKDFYKDASYDVEFSEIMDSELRQYYKGRYLLQVWQQNKGWIWEKVLKAPPRTWFIYDRSFTYKLSLEDENQERYLRNVYVKYDDKIQETTYKEYPENDACILLELLKTPIVTFCLLQDPDSYLYYGSPNEVYVIYTRDIDKEQGLKLSTIKLPEKTNLYYLQVPEGIRFHGVRNWYFLFEDDKYNFFQTIPEYRSQTNNYGTIKLNTDFEGEPIKEQYYPIDKHIFYKTKGGRLYDLILRKESKQVEVYLDQEKVYDSKVQEQKRVFIDIEINNDYAYLKTVNFTYQISLESKKFEVTDDKITNLVRDTNWYYIYQDKIRAHVQLFGSYTISGTYLFVSYEKMIFKYTFLDSKIRRYIIKLENEIDQIFAKNNKGEIYVVYAYKEQGAGAEEMKEDNKDITKVHHLNEKGEVQNTYELKGQIVDEVFSQSDDQLNQCKIVITKDKKDEKQIYLLPYTHDDSLNNLTSEVNLDKNEKLIKCFDYQSRGYYYSFALVNEEKKEIRKYKRSSPYYISDDKYDMKKFADQWSLSEILAIVQISESSLDTVIITKSGIIKADLSGLEFKQLMSGQSFNLQYLEIVDNQYLYYQDSEGLQCLNLQTLINKDPDTAQTVLIQYTYIDQNYIFYHPMSQRLCFLTHNQSLKIVPMAHDNIIVPFGYNNHNGTFEENKIHAVKIIHITKDNEPKKLVAIDDKNNLISWVFPTGKLLNKYKIGRILTEGFELYPYTDIHYKKCNRPALVYYKELAKEDQHEEEESQMMGDKKNKTKFEFKIIEIASDMDIELLASFQHQINKTEDRLYFSSDFNKMIHVDYDSGVKEVKVYQLRQDFEEDPCRTVLAVKSIQNFPKEYYERDDVLFMFSPDFHYFIDFDSIDQELKICRTIKTSESRNSDIIINYFDTEERNFDPVKVFKHFTWVDNNSFKIINEEGVENLYDIVQGCAHVKSSSLIPMKGDYGDQQKNFYYQQFSHLNTSVYERLVKKYQLFQLEKLQTDQEENSNNVQDFDIEYCYDNHASVQIEMNFTYYHWKLAEYIIKQNTEKVIDKLGLPDIKLLLLNIFPFTKNTFLHKAVDILGKKIKDQGAENEKNKQSIDAKVTFNSKILKNMFKILYDDTINQTFYFPFIKNEKGLTPFEISPEKNVTSITVMLKYLAKQPIYSHSKDILRLIPILMSLGIDVGEYLDSRIQESAFTKKFMTIYDFKPIYAKNYQITSTWLWPDHEDFADQFKEFPKTKKQKNCCERFINFFVGEKENTTELDVKVEVLDLPFLNNIKPHRRKAAEQFFKALSDVDGYDLFKYKSVQYLIDFKWKIIRKYTMGLLFLPFLLYFLTFIVYSNIFNGKDDLDGDWLTAFVVLSGVLYFFSIYFLSNEFAQLIQNKLDYFTDSLIWNILDITPSLLIITVVSARLRQRFTSETYEESSFMDTVHAIASLMMWLKFMYFLRLFEATGYLIRIVLNMMWDMKIFILILFIVELGFGEAFLRLSEKSPEEGQFLQNFGFAFIYSFRLTLGDNDTEAYEYIAQPITAWVLFVCCEVFTNIVMLNLLVTIIGQSFEEINENSKLANFKERAKLIYENSYLIKLCRCCREQGILEKRDFLLIITDISNEDSDESSDVIHEIQETIKKLVTENQVLKQSLENIEKNMNQKFDDLNSKVEKSNQNISTEIISALDGKMQSMTANVADTNAKAQANIEKLVNSLKK